MPPLTLLNIPNEILSDIAIHVSTISDLYALARTCRTLHSLIHTTSKVSSNVHLAVLRKRFSRVEIDTVNMWRPGGLNAFARRKLQEGTARSLNLGAEDPSLSPDPTVWGQAECKRLFADYERIFTYTKTFCWNGVHRVFAGTGVLNYYEADKFVGAGEEKNMSTFLKNYLGYNSALHKNFLEVDVGRECPTAAEPFFYRMILTLIIRGIYWFIRLARGLHPPGIWDFSVCEFPLPAEQELTFGCLQLEDPSGHMSADRWFEVANDDGLCSFNLVYLPFEENSTTVDTFRTVHWQDYLDQHFPSKLVRQFTWVDIESCTAKAEDERTTARVLMDHYTWSQRKEELGLEGEFQLDAFEPLIINWEYWGWPRLLAEQSSEEQLKQLIKDTGVDPNEWEFIRFASRFINGLDKSYGLI